MKNTKNTKGLLALAVASTIILVGCGGKPVHPIDPIAEVQPKLEDISDIVPTKKSIRLIPDDFVVHSNHNLNLEYTPPYGFYEDRFEHVKSREDALAVEKAIRGIQSSLISEISNTLTKNPHEASDTQHINALQKGSGSSESIPTIELVKHQDLTSLFIIDKFDDAYMNEHHAIEGVTDFMVQLDAYEENLENAESVEEIIVTLFENDQFVVKLSPSSRAISSSGSSAGDFNHALFSSEEFNNAKALNLLDEYVDYFKTPKVKSIIEDALGQKF